jgi:hypothetical protein
MTDGNIVYLHNPYTGNGACYFRDKYTGMLSEIRETIGVKMTAIDYRALLKKYMHGIREHESITFVSRIGGHVDFTPEEAAELGEIEEEVIREAKT